MSKTKITLQRHVQYGRERLYPACRLSRAICMLMKMKTFNDDHATILTGIGGVEIEVEDVKERPIYKGE